MPHLPIRLAKLLALAASAAFSVFLFAGSGPASAVPAQQLKGLTSPALPVEQAGGYGRRHYRSYPNYRSYSYDYPAYYGYGYRSYGRGQDEIRELQRLYPSTNWPPSMRYHQY